MEVRRRIVFHSATVAEWLMYVDFGESRRFQDYYGRDAQRVKDDDI